MAKTRKDNMMWNMCDAFWVFHTNPEHLTEYFTAKLNYAKGDESAERRATDITEATVAHWSTKFENDFLTFLLNMIDRLYFDVCTSSSIMVEKRKNPHFRPPMFQVLDLASSNDLLRKFKIVLDEIEGLHEEISKFLSAYPYTKEFPLKDYPAFQPSDIRTVKDFLAHRTLPQLQESPEKVKSVRNAIKTLDGMLNALSRKIEALVCDYTDNDFHEATKLLRDSPQTADYITMLRYCLDSSFNCEAILLFLYGKIDISSHKYLALVVKKHEVFFNNIYTNLLSVSSVVKDLIGTDWKCCPSEIEEPYYDIGKSFHPPQDGRSILFHLKKLLDLHEFYCKSSQADVFPSIHYGLNSYRKILIETKLDNVLYNPLKEDLPNCVLESMGLNQKDLAEILDVDESTISRQIKAFREGKDKNILTQHLWFWRVFTGFTYTYLNGETTIPHYGKLDSEGSTYGMAPMLSMAYAELFLEHIVALKEYSTALKEGKIPAKKKYVLTQSYLRQISKEAGQLARRIQEHRISLDRMFEYIQSQQKSKRDLIISNRTGIKESEEHIQELKSKMPSQCTDRKERIRCDTIRREINRLQKNIENLQNANVHMRDETNRDQKLFERYHQLLLRMISLACKQDTPMDILRKLYSSMSNADGYETQQPRENTDSLRADLENYIAKQTEKLDAIQRILNHHES